MTDQVDTVHAEDDAMKFCGAKMIVDIFVRVQLPESVNNA